MRRETVTSYKSTLALALTNERNREYNILRTPTPELLYYETDLPKYTYSIIPQ